MIDENLKLVVYDFETTGRNSNWDQIIQVGAVLVNFNFQEIDKRKYLVPKDLNINQFTFIIRKRINLDPSQAIFIMIDNTLCPSNTTVGEIYEDKHDKDGFLYVTYSSENTFG